jgi:hypothetical protein
MVSPGTVKRAEQRHGIALGDGRSTLNLDWPKELAIARKRKESTAELARRVGASRHAVDRAAAKHKVCLRNGRAARSERK